MCIGALGTTIPASPQGRYSQLLRVLFPSPAGPQAKMRRHARAWVFNIDTCSAQSRWENTRDASGGRLKRSESMRGEKRAERHQQILVLLALRRHIGIDAVDHRRGGRGRRSTSAVHNPQRNFVYTCASLYMVIMYERCGRVFRGHTRQAAASMNYGRSQLTLVPRNVMIQTRQRSQRYVAGGIKQIISKHIRTCTYSDMRGECDSIS